MTDTTDVNPLVSTSTSTSHSTLPDGVPAGNTIVPATTDNAPSNIRPYLRSAKMYWDAGWEPIPLPRGKKLPPPTGYTGRTSYGKTLEEHQVAEWEETHPNGNIALRMPPKTGAFDVDAYLKGGVVKDGETTLRALLQEYGPLPPTVMSSARPTSVGHIFYRLPRIVVTNPVTGRETERPIMLPSVPGPGIEAIQRHHRYSVVWPSTNPDADGATYRFYLPGPGEGVDFWEGRVLQEEGWVPRVEDLPELPEAWCNMLALPGAERSNARTGRELSVTPVSLRQAAEAIERWERSGAGGDKDRNLAKEIIKRYRSRVGSGEARHDSCMGCLTWACKAGAAGLINPKPVVDELHRLFSSDTSDRHIPGEFESMLVWAVPNGEADGPAYLKEWEAEREAYRQRRDKELLGLIPVDPSRTPGESLFHPSELIDGGNGMVSEAAPEKPVTEDFCQLPSGRPRSLTTTDQYTEWRKGYEAKGVKPFDIPPYPFPEDELLWTAHCVALGQCGNQWRGPWDARLEQMAADVRRTADLTPEKIPAVLQAHAHEVSRWDLPTYDLGSCGPGFEVWIHFHKKVVSTYMGEEEARAVTDTAVNMARHPMEAVRRRRDLDPGSWRKTVEAVDSWARETYPVKSASQDETSSEKTETEEQEEINRRQKMLEKGRRYARRELDAEEMEKARGPRKKQTIGDFAKEPKVGVIVNSVLAAEVNLLGGPSGGGKSLLARDWSLSVASGLPWRTHTVPEPRNVLWIASEGTHDVEERWTKQPLYEQAKDRLFIIPDPVSLVSAHDVQWLIDEYAEERPGLIVFDVLYGMGMEDDNDMKSALPILNAMKKISAAFECATLGVGHSGHAGERRFRGSSSWRQLAAVEWHMAEGSITCEKSKIAHAGGLRAAYEVSFPEIKYLGAVESMGREADILLIIKKNIQDNPTMSDNKRAAILQAATGLGVSTLRRKIKDMKEEIELEGQESLIAIT